MMIFGYEMGSTQVVVTGRSNWCLDPKGTHRAQKRGPKRECVVVLSVHCLSVAARVITFLASRCEFLNM